LPEATPPEHAVSVNRDAPASGARRVRARFEERCEETVVEIRGLMSSGVLSLGPITAV
jgi:hypothetical protein